MYDAKLTETGKKQGIAVARHFEHIHLDAIYSSDISRAVIMANEIAQYHGLTVRYEKRLREINLGDWEGLHISEMQEKWPQQYHVWITDQGHCICPNGESITDVQRRVMDGIRAIAAEHPNETVLCVSHGLALKTVLVELTGAPLSQFRELKYVTNASITTLQVEGDQIALVSYGDHSYLSSEMVTHIFSQA